MFWLRSTITCCRVEGYGDARQLQQNGMQIFRGLDTGAMATLKNEFKKMRKSFISIACMDLRRLHTTAFDERSCPPLDGGNLPAKFPPVVVCGEKWEAVLASDKNL
jgi:hypothetical protein